MNIKNNNPVVADLVNRIEINSDNLMKVNLVIQMIDSSSMSGEMTSSQLSKTMGISDGFVRKLQKRASAKLNTHYDALLKEEERFLNNKMEESKIWQN